MKKKKCFESRGERAAIKVQKKWRENRIESNKRARRCAEAGEALHLKRLEFAMAEKAKEAKALHARGLYHGKLFAMKRENVAGEPGAEACSGHLQRRCWYSEEDIIRRGCRGSRSRRIVRWSAFGHGGVEGETS